MSDLYYDAQGEFIGPKYWTTEVYVDCDNNYVTAGMKYDEYVYETPVYLAPAGDPVPVPSGTGPVRPVRPTPR